MPRSVLVPMDHSPPSKAALEHALSMYPDAAVTVLHVIDPTDAARYGQAISPARHLHDATERAEELFEQAEALAADCSAELTTRIERGAPARTIEAFARDHDVDHIVMGSHGRTGLRRVLFGSVAELVARRATVPVTVVR